MNSLETDMVRFNDLYIPASSTLYHMCMRMCKFKLRAKSIFCPAHNVPPHSAMKKND